MEKIILLLLLSSTQFAHGFYLNTNIDAGFGDSDVKIYVTSNSTCTNAGISKEELLDMAMTGAKKYWNNVPTANLNLKRGGILQTTDAKFLTEKLCATDSATTCPTATSVPKVSDIVIACNSNSTDNFPSSEFLALTAPINISSSEIKGSVILINDTATSAFNTLSRDEMISALAHEIGHAIGLGHTDQSEALMYHKNNEDRRKLAQDDIDGVSYLYPNQFDGCKSIFGLMTINQGNSNPPKNSFLLSLIFGLSIGLLSCNCMIKITYLLSFRRRTNLS